MMGKPKIRFKGYNEDWEQRKFSELYAKSSEKNDGSIGMDKNITVATMQFKEDVKVSTAEYLKTYYTFNLGDIAFEGHQSKEFRYGRFVENDIGNGIVSHIFAVFRPIREYDLYFWKYAINNETLMQRILSRSTKASTMMHDLVTKDFLNEMFLVPSFDEQRQIGVFLDTLDHLITLHQHKCDEMKKLKKCMLQKMFPQNGKKVPEIRFEGFTNDWEQRKLGEVFEFQYGEFNNNPDNGGEYPIYGANGIIGGYTDWNAENSSIIGHMGAYAGYVVWGEGKHFVTYNGTIARPKDNSIDSKYGYYLLDSKKIYKICAGSGQPFVSYSDLNGIDILLPKDKDEQRLLAYYFTNLDHLITLHQHKCDELQNLKKYMLQNMFV